MFVGIFLLVYCKNFVSQPSSSPLLIDSTTSLNGSSVMFCLYCCSSNSYITGTFSDSIPAKVFAFTGNGKSSTNQISLSFSLYQPTTIVSSVPLGVVIVSTLFGIKLDTNPPPTGPNAPHDVLLNSCGP